MILKIKDLLREKSCTGKRLAEMIGVNRVTMINIINGKNNPSFDTLLKIAAALEVPVWMLFATREEAASEDLVAFFRYKGKNHLPTTFDEVLDVLKEIDEALYHEICRSRCFQHIRERYVENKDVQKLMDDLCAMLGEPCQWIKDTDNQNQEK